MDEEVQAGRPELALRGRLRHVERTRHDPKASKDGDGCTLNWNRGSKIEFLGRVIFVAVWVAALLPAQKWRVHHIARPKPSVVTPAARIGQPPSDALVLFDGKDLSHWTKPAWNRQVGRRAISD